MARTPGEGKDTAAGVWNDGSSKLCGRIGKTSRRPSESVRRSRRGKTFCYSASRLFRVIYEVGQRLNERTDNLVDGSVITMFPNDISNVRSQTFGLVRMRCRIVLARIISRAIRRWGFSFALLNNGLVCNGRVVSCFCWLVNRVARLEVSIGMHLVEQFVKTAFRTFCCHGFDEADFDEVILHLLFAIIGLRFKTGSDFGEYLTFFLFVLFCFLG